MKILTAFSLLLLTVLCIALPLFTDILQFENNLNKKEHWTHEMKLEVGLTSAQIVDYYKNSFDDLSFGDDSYDYDINTEDIEKSAIELLDTVFGGDGDISEYFKSTISRSARYGRKYQVVSADSEPHIVEIISVSVFSDGEEIGFVYENKTKTLLLFFCSSYGVYKIGDAVYGHIIDYCENDLCLAAGQYYCHYDRKYIIGFSVLNAIERENIEEKIYDKSGTYLKQK